MRLPTSPWKLDAPSQLTAARRYGVSLAGVGLVLVVDLLLWPYLRWSVSPIFFAVVVFAAWYGGTGPALATTLVSAALINYFFMSPMYRFVLKSDDILWISAYLLVSFALTGLFAALRRSQRALIHQSESFRVTLSSIADAVVTIDTAGRVTFMNPVAEDLTGWRMEEASGQDLDRILRFVGESKEDHTFGVMNELLGSEEGLGQRRDALLVSREGRTYTVESTTAPIRTDEGRLEGAVLVFRDITQRRESENALRTSEARLRFALDAAGMGIWDWEIATGALSWSENLEPLHGFAKGTFDGTLEAFQSRIHPEDAASVSAAIRRSIEEGAPYDKEFRIVWPDGTVRWMAGKGEVIRDETGLPTRMVGVGLDVTDRRRAEEAVRESEARFRTMADTAPVLIWMAGADGQCVWFNRPWLVFTGRTMEEEVGTGWTHSIHPDDRTRYEHTFEKAFGLRRSFRTEYRLRRHDGAFRWLLVEAVPSSTPDGTFTGYIGSCVDITDRIAAEEQLRALTETLEEQVAERTHAVERRAEELARSEQAFREQSRVLESILNSMGEGVVVADHHGQVTIWNTEARRLVGPPPWSVPLHEWAIQFSAFEQEESDLPIRGESAVLQAARGLLVDREVLVHRADASNGLWLSVTGRPVIDEGADRWGTVIVFRDISARKRAEKEQVRLLQQAEAAEARFRELFEYAPDAALLTDGEGRIALVNSRAESLFGYHRDALVGQPIEVLVPERFRAHHGAYRVEYQRNPSVRPMALGRDLHGLRADGTEFPVEISLSPLETPDGAMVMSVVRDISERKSLEEALRQSERLAAIGQMITGLSHESRNALQRSLACLEMLGRKIHDRADAMRLLAEAQRAQRDLQQVYEEVRSYAAPVHLERSRRSMLQVWRSAWNSLAGQVDGRQVRLREECGETDLTVEADEFRMEQVFRNLFENSIAAAPEPTLITVACCDDTLDARPALKIMVRDNGPGLEEEQAQRIFEPFYTTKTKGTGLGMSIVKRIVESHNGRIAVTSPADGGLEVAIVLPRKAT